MPIRFRCQHCRQLLGIAASRSGADVPCPLCGRMIRVPAESESLAPIPERQEDPETFADWHDPSLREALDILRSDVPEESHIAGEPDSAAIVIVEPLPAPEIEPIEPVMLPEYSAAMSRPAAGDSGDDSPPPLDWHQEIAQLGANAPPAEATAPRPFVPLILGLFAVLIFLAGLTGGWFLGRTNADPRPSAAAPDDIDGESAPAAADPAAAPLAGRVRVGQPNGPGQPDAGAVVLLLPVNWTLQRPPVPAEGLRPGEPPEAFEAALQRLTPHGAAAAVADETGTFALPDVAPGEYFLLILSRFAASEGREADALAEMALYLDRPPTLLGRRAHRWQRLDLRADVMWRVEVEF